MLDVVKDADNEILRAENKALREIIECFPGGVIAYDHNLRVMICNTKQKELLEYPPYLFEFGMPSLEQVIRFNATRSEYGPGDIETQVRDRMALAAKRVPHCYTRRRPSGTLIEVRGEPLPNGGYVTCYIEKTADAAVELADRASDPSNKAKVLQKIEFLERINDVIGKSHLVSAVHYIELQKLDRIREVAGSEGEALAGNVLEQRLLKTLRAADIVVRLETGFAVFQHGIERPSDVTRLQHRVVESCRSPMALGSVEVECDLKLGVALSPRDGRKAATLLSLAKQSLDARV